jgi:hypothetical protein
MESRIQEAIQYLKSCPEASLARVAREYEVLIVGLA